MSEPRKSATDAMRLRPATRSRADAAAGARALDELLELHAEALVGLCRECITEHPCRTRRLAETVAGTRTPREDSTQ